MIKILLLKLSTKPRAAFVRGLQWQGEQAAAAGASNRARTMVGPIGRAKRQGWALSVIEPLQIYWPRGPGSGDPWKRGAPARERGGRAPALGVARTTVESPGVKSVGSAVNLRTIKDLADRPHYV
jgi:hypothetical protein